MVGEGGGGGDGGDAGGGYGKGGEGGGGEFTADTVPAHQDKISVGSVCADMAPRACLHLLLAAGTELRLSSAANRGMDGLRGEPTRQDNDLTLLTRSAHAFADR